NSKQDGPNKAMPEKKKNKWAQEKTWTFKAGRAKTHRPHFGVAASFVWEANGISLPGKALTAGLLHPGREPRLVSSVFSMWCGCYRKNNSSTESVPPPRTHAFHTMKGIIHRSMAHRQPRAISPATTSSTIIPSPPGIQASSQLIGHGLSTSKKRNSMNAIRTP